MNTDYVLYDEFGDFDDELDRDFKFFRNIYRSYNIFKMITSKIIQSGLYNANIKFKIINHMDDTKNLDHIIIKPIAHENMHYLDKVFYAKLHKRVINFKHYVYNGEEAESISGRKFAILEDRFNLVNFDIQKEYFFVIQHSYELKLWGRNQLIFLILKSFNQEQASEYKFYHPELFI